MELRHLRYFVAVAEERSVSRAAERLAIAQPPLSQQMRRLERELGFPLFERQPGGVILTRAGEALLPHARDLLRAAADATAAATAAHRGDAGHLALGFINGAAYRVLPALLRAYRDTHPVVEVAVRELAIADQLDALQARRIDAGLLRPPVDDPRLDFLVIARERFVVAMAHDHACARRASLILRDLDDVAVVAYPRGHRAGFRERIDAALAAQRSVPRIAQEATQLHTLCGLAAARVGMAIVPASAEAFSIPGLCFVPLRDLAARAEIALAWRKNDPSAQVAALVAAARSVRLASREPGRAATSPASPATPAPRANPTRVRARHR